MKTIHAIVEGRVQGVCFRDYTKRQALQLNLCGWVRNLPNGTVETLIQGGEDEVSSMVKWLSQGSPNSKVDKVHSAEISSKEDFCSFEVRY